MGPDCPVLLVSVHHNIPCITKKQNQITIRTNKVLVVHTQAHTTQTVTSGAYMLLVTCITHTRTNMHTYISKLPI